MTQRAVHALKTLPPVPDGYPHWVKFFVDGGTILGRHSRRIRGVYWSMRCENGTASVTLRLRDLEKYKTNNDAEWLALREALRYAVEHCAEMPIIIYSDSQLVVKQFNDEWRTKIARHHHLRSECRQYAEQLKFVAVQWVPREVNVVKLGH